MAKRIVAAFLVLVFALSLFSCEEQDSYTENEILDYSFCQGKDDYSIKIIERSTGEGADSYICQYVFEVSGPVESQTKKYIYETKKYSRLFTPDNLEGFIKKDSVLKKVEYDRVIAKAEPLTGKPLLDDNGQPIAKETKKETLYDLICSYQARHTFLLAAETCDPWFGTDYTNFAFEMQSIRAKILSKNLVAQLCGTIEGKLDKKEDFSKIIVENIFKDSKFATKAIDIGDFAETTKSSIEETNTLCNSIAYITRCFTDIGITKLLEDKKGLEVVSSTEELMDYVKTNYINSEAKLLCEKLLDAFKDKTKNKRLTIVDVKLDTTSKDNQKIESEVQNYTTYKTRFAELNLLSVPQFEFIYPNDWKITKEEVVVNQVADIEEWVEIKSSTGVTITYMSMTASLGGNGRNWITGDAISVAKSAFVPGYVQATDYSTLGEFVVAKVHETRYMQLDTEYERELDNYCYAVIPKTELGEIGYAGRKDGLSFHYGGRTHRYLFMVEYDSAKCSKKDEAEIVKILESFKLS